MPEVMSRRIWFHPWIVWPVCQLVIPALALVAAWKLLYWLGLGEVLSAFAVLGIGCMALEDGKRYAKAAVAVMTVSGGFARLRDLGAFAGRFVGPHLLAGLAVFLAGTISYEYQFLVPPLVGLTAGVCAYVAARLLLGTGHAEEPTGGSRIERGRQLLAEDEVMMRAEAASSGAPRTLIWGGVPLPLEAADTHFSVAGGTRSGKTLTLRLLMQSVLSGIRSGGNERALVFDPKGEMMGVLLGMGLDPASIKTLHPVDARCYAWDIAADLDDPDAAKTVAAILVPEEQETQKYFPRAARRLLEGVLSVFMQTAPGQWKLEDAFVVLNDLTLLKRALESCPNTRGLIEKYFKPTTTFKNTISTLDTLVSRYETLAACWSQAADEGRKLSLRDWVKESSILVIKREPDIEESLDPMNRVIFERLAQLLLAGPEVAQVPAWERPRTWLFLDEAAKAGKLKKLDDLVLQGSSKGVTVVLGFQDILAMRKEYSRESAESLLGQVGNKSFLKLNCEATAKWASQLFGEYEGIEQFRSESESWTRDGRQESESISEQRHKRDAVLPSEFFTLPYPSETEKLHGYYLTSCIGAYRLGYGFASGLAPRADVEEVVRRPATDKVLKLEFSAEDRQRLGLVGESKKPSDQHSIHDIKRRRRDRPTEDDA